MLSRCLSLSFARLQLLFLLLAAESMFHLFSTRRPIAPRYHRLGCMALIFLRLEIHNVRMLLMDSSYYGFCGVVSNAIAFQLLCCFEFGLGWLDILTIHYGL